MEIVDEVSDGYITVIGQLCGVSELVEIALFLRTQPGNRVRGWGDKLYLLFVRIFLAMNLWKTAV